MGVDWVPANGYGTWGQIPYTLGPGTTVPFTRMLFSTGLSASSRVAAPDTDPERVTVKRIVGTICWYFDPQGETPFLDYSWRITKGLLTSGGTVDVFTTSLNNANAANEPFMHERKFQVFPPEGVPQLTWDPLHASVDIRVSRTLQGQECIAFVGNIATTVPWDQTVSAQGNLWFRTDLRAWVTTSD